IVDATGGGLASIIRPDPITHESAGWSASATFRPLSPVTPWRAIDVRGATDDDARALLVPIERGRMMLVLRGAAAAVSAVAGAPPIDAESLLRYARALGHPALTAALPRADHLGPIVVRHHSEVEADADARGYDASGGWPGRFISFGVTSRWPDLADAADAMTL